MRCLALVLLLLPIGCAAGGPTTRPTTRPTPPPNPPLTGPEYYPLHKALSGPRK